MPFKAPEKDREDKQEVTSILAATKESSVAVAVVAVLSKQTAVKGTESFFFLWTTYYHFTPGWLWQQYR